MRLLHTTSLELTQFNDSDILLYGILSHTWEDGEVSFQDLQSHGVEENAGYAKIRGCSKIAAEDAYTSYG